MAWYRANGISEKLFFYWQRVLSRGAFEDFEDCRNSTLRVTAGPHQGVCMGRDGYLVLYKRLELGGSSRFCRKERRGTGDQTGIISDIDAGGIVSRHPIQEVHLWKNVEND